MFRKLRNAILILTVVLVSAETANAGFFQRLWQLEQRKNAWLREVFFGRR
jgi:hypothetical protein